MSSVENLRGEALAQAIDVAVLRKGLDTVEAQGEAAVELIEEAGEVVEQAPLKAHSGELGQLIDIYM